MKAFSYRDLKEVRLHHPSQLGFRHILQSANSRNAGILNDCVERALEASRSIAQFT